MTLNSWFYIWKNNKFMKSKYLLIKNEKLIKEVKEIYDLTRNEFNIEILHVYSHAGKKDPLSIGN